MGPTVADTIQFNLVALVVACAALWVLYWLVSRPPGPPGCP